MLWRRGFPDAAAGFSPGAACRARIPVREGILASRPPEGISLHNIVPGTVFRIAEDAVRRSVVVEIALPAGRLLARVTPDAIARLGLGLGAGAPVLALIKSTLIEVLGG
jgi:molybdate transport system ATP-binding protein